MDTSTLGERIRNIRRRRGLTQRELATAAGVSPSLVKKLERGEYGGMRVETARKIAVALDVTTTALISSAEPEEDRTAGIWDQVREAVTSPAASSAGIAPVSPASFAQALTDAVNLYQGHRYDELARLLPLLLADARDADPLLKSRAYGLAGSVLIQTRHRETAAAALDTAMNASSGSDMDAVATVNTRCWLMILERKYAEVMQLATEWADRIEPKLSTATPLQLSAWGWLLLRGSAAAIRDNRPDEAEDMMRLARAAASAIRPGGESPHPYWNLGNLTPAVVVMKKAENALIEGQPDVTLRLADRVPTGLRAMDNRNRHLLDVSAAHLEMRRHDDAFGVLAQLRAEAGPWLAEQRYSRDILSRIVGRRRTLTPEMRELADAIRLPL